MTLNQDPKNIYWNCTINIACFFCVHIKLVKKVERRTLCGDEFRDLEHSTAYGLCVGGAGGSIIGGNLSVLVYCKFMEDSRSR